ncbi:MAG TPA: glycoside hydrolase family 36 protein [Polyangia bacterium]|nr:glycoside hydrolase family 36 protein [Polyangia bacterium]
MSTTLLLLTLALAVTPESKRSHKVAGLDLEVLGDMKGFALDLATVELEPNLAVVDIKLTSPTPQVPPSFTLEWAIPAHNVAGHWSTGRNLDKSVKPDFASSRLQPSMFARNAPVNTLFGNGNENILTFAVSDALNTVVTGAGVSEEHATIRNQVTFFSEKHERLTEYRAKLRLDRRKVPYYTALAGVSDWWAKQPDYAPASVPEPARLPMYSTWYNYHQSLDPKVLLDEVAAAKRMGFDAIIVDDGWQTMDTGRGYAFTGDWKPERIPDMKGFVDGCHKLGVKVLLWYAVPFVGKNAQVTARLKDKTLRYEDRLGAYVLDPRFPEVRAYLIDVYRRAIRDWGIDGFKLDFIERFAADEKTVLEARGGRDRASVNEAADRLLTDVLSELRKVKPDVMIEFRQPYIGPLIRKYGNMFRASDCPNSYLLNRVRTLDLRLLSGNTAVHADMIMWHPGEPVELAAFQLVNVLFSVPQVSVRLGEIPKDHFEMIRFYIAYWNANRNVLLDGKLVPQHPDANYPVVTASDGRKQIVGLYGDSVVGVDPGARDAIDVINGKGTRLVVLSSEKDLGSYRYVVRDCQGRVQKKGQVGLKKGVVDFTVPVSGMLSLERVGAKPGA